MTSPDHLSPDGAQSATSLGPFYQNADPEALGIGANTETNALLQLMQNNFFTQILGGFTSAISAVADGITSIVEAITGILGGTLADLDQWSSDIKDGQLALNDRVELLSPLEDYGSCYAPGQGGLLVDGTGVKPFTQQIGPMTGCHKDGSGRIVLGDKGLWEITARMSWSWTALSGEVGWYVRVLRPDGSVFSQQLDAVTDNGDITRHITTTVVVPDSGYKVEVYVSKSVTGREIFGGPTHNRLIVHHITRSTEFPI